MRLKRLEDVYVLRWGHRPRDFRVTTHVALTARAFKAKGFFLSDVEDIYVKRSINETVNNWGGPFEFCMGTPWKETIKEWRMGRGFVVHLTMYGVNLDKELISKIRVREGDLLLVVGSRKVPREFFSQKISDFNIAVGNQPHSEVAAVAIFLDRLLKKSELSEEFKDAKFKVIPSERGKRILHIK